jgi:hypothetical protein
MENTEKEKLKEQILEDIKRIDWDIEYHEGKLSEAKIKMQISEYALKQLIADSYAE